MSLLPLSPHVYYDPASAAGRFLSADQQGLALNRDDSDVIWGLVEGFGNAFDSRGKRRYKGVLVGSEMPEGRCDSYEDAESLIGMAEWGRDL